MLAANHDTVQVVRRLIAGLVVLVATQEVVRAQAAPLPAALPAVDDLSIASRHYEALDYEQAIAVATRVEKRRGATAPQRIDALLLIALAHLSLVDPAATLAEENQGHQRAASSALAAILALDWQFELASGHPANLRAAFVLAQEEFARTTALAAHRRCGALPTVAADVPARPSGGQPLALRLRFSDPRGCARSVRFTWARQRLTGSSLNREIVAVQGSAATLTVPAEATTSSSGVELAYYAEVYDGQHGQLTTLGSFSQPRRIQIDAGAPAKPLLRRWWFWVGTAAVVASSVYLVRQAVDAGPQTVTIGRTLGSMP
jgi:hypothetical protein